MAVKLTKKIRDTVIRKIRQGNYRKHAAVAAGVSESVLGHWMALGQLPDAQEPYRSFAAGVITAEGLAACDAVKHLTDASQGDWRASLEFLKRKFPHEWGDTAKRSITEQLDLILQVVEDILGHEHAQRVCDEIARRAGPQKSQSARRPSAGPLH